jgi:hypothetical protein
MGVVQNALTSKEIEMGRYVAAMLGGYELCKCGLTNKLQPITNPGCGSGWTNNFQL